MSHLEFLGECDCLLKWIASKGSHIKITQDQLEEFAQPFKNTTEDLITHLFKSGHVESFYGNRIAATIQGLEFAKSSSYTNEFEDYKKKYPHPLLFLLDSIDSIGIAIALLLFIFFIIELL